MNPFRRKSNFKPSERGQALIVIAFSIIGLFGMSALAIDGGNAFYNRRKAQTAADSAALTGAITRIEGGNWRLAALDSARVNGYDNDGETNSVELNTPPIDGPYLENPEYIQVIITSRFNTFFGSVIGVKQITVRTQAISRSKPAVYGAMFDGYALVSLAPRSKCDRERSFWIHAEATVSLEGGGIFINSDNPACAFASFGNGSVRIHDASPFSMVGGASIQKPQLITPYPPQTGGVSMPYPPAYQMPKVGCGSKMAEVDELTGIMTAGNWDADFPPVGVHKLEGGIYCIQGDVNVTQKLTGDGVVLYLQGGEARFSGDTDIQLSAPRNGDLKGLLIYMPIENLHHRIALNGGADSSYRGTILAPSADIRINGMESAYGFHSQIIGYTIEVDGQSNIIIKYKVEDNYETFKMPEVVLVQ